MSENIGWYERIVDWLRLRTQTATPQTPPANDWKLYFRSDGLYTLDSAGTETGPLGTGGGSIGIWEPDAAPDSAHAKDDEFDDESLDVKWTEWDEVGNITVSEVAAGLSMVQTTAAANQWGGIYQAVPASGDWAIWTKLHIMGVNTKYNMAGLLLGEDLTSNPSTSDFYWFGVSYGESNFVQILVQRWTKYDTYGAAFLGSIYIQSPTLYVRIRKASTTYSFDISNDGMGWIQMYSGTLTFTPAEFGLCVNNNNSGNTHRAIFSFFRCTTNNALTDITEGNRV